MNVSCPLPGHLALPCPQGTDPSALEDTGGSQISGRDKYLHCGTLGRVDCRIPFFKIFLFLIERPIVKISIMFCI